ncbi:MAG TPA: response regulator transcription factor [Candidatus Sulfotelmatobacter sp.]
MSPSSCAIAGAISVLVADSNRMRAQLLISALRRGSEFHLVICGMDSASIHNAIASAPARVALLSADSSSGFADCLGIIRQFHLAYPAIVKILLLESSEREIVLGAFRSGVRGVFCLNDASLRLLRKCIHSVAQGEIWANAEQVNYVFERMAEGPLLHVLNHRGDKLLTPREEQVVALVAEGLGNRDIAATLKLSEHTVKKYLFRIFDKLGISTRVELVLYAVDFGARTATVT